MDLVGDKTSFLFHTLDYYWKKKKKEEVLRSFG
jgi:hypothetical protein